MSALKDLTGKQFGRLTAVEPTNKRIGSFVVWKCFCTCGNVRYIQSSSLLGGVSKSCGCLQKERSSKAHLNDVSGTIIKGISVIRMSNKKYKSNGKYCFAICPTCGSEWEVQVQCLKSLNSTQCQRCTFKQRVSKTATILLDKLEEMLGLKVVREYRIGNKYFDGYIPELKLLIESDGSYWHNVRETNDLFKEQLAKTAGLILIRVTNDSFADHNTALKEILQSVS
jgi:very-short-patch-repair endonuclease